ncbi:hypothetical protein OG235_27870 [Streptomyces sp. NBC_00024]|uniref:hypothetical protein n=1 Tax=Streptomyces sp. NBC_00024 TaxID=2903612 RepID=UPI0032505A0D
MPEDTPQGEEQPTMLSFTEAAERLVEDRIAPNMTAEGLRRLARDPKSGWPIGPGDYRVVGKTRTLPYDVLAEYMRERLGKRRGRGPDTKKRGKRTQQQGDPVITTDTPREWRLTPETLDPFVRALVNHVDYDIHKGYECGEEDGLDHYPELVAEAAEMLDAITGSKAEES